MDRLLAVAVAVATACMTAAPAQEAAKPAAAARFVLGPRTAGSQTQFHKKGLGYTAGGFVEVAQPKPDTLVVTMTGLAACGGLPLEDSAAGVTFDLIQELCVATNRPDVAGVKLTAEATLGGLLRCSRAGPGAAAVTCASATVGCGGLTVARAAFEPRSHAGRGAAYLNDHQGPAACVVPTGPVVLHAAFGIEATHPKKCFHKNVAVAAFGPDAARPPDWIGILDPSRDLPKRDAGFRVVLTVEPLPPGAPLPPVVAAPEPAPAPAASAK